LKFSEFDLRPELLSAIVEAGYTEATPIQDAVIPSVLKGKDVSGLAQTGTGKTAAFVIPLIDRIIRYKAGETGERVPSNWKKNSFVLVLVPTRELAVQVEEAISQFGKLAGMKSTVVVGGEAYDEQRRALREGVEFVVGTPGRLLDLYKSHSLDLNGVGAIVFDEADRMFDMGFKEDMKFILKRVPRDRQFLLFSATLNFDVLNTSYQFGAEPIEFNVSRDQVTAEGISHEILHVGQEDKPMYLLSVLKKEAPLQCIVFSNFKHNVARISKFLKNNGIEATEMSSLLSQTQRNKVLETFKTGKKQILVATDVAARGLDIKGVDLVINFDLPDEAQGYVHRIGRTGRAGTSGKAVGLVSDRDVDALGRIEEYLKEKVKIGWLDEAELLKEFKPFPAQDFSSRPNLGRSSGGGGAGGFNKSRPPQRNNSQPRRPGPPQQRPPAKVAHGQTANSQSKAPLGQHRDRVQGRHGSHSGNPALNNNNNNNRTQNRPQQNGNNQNSGPTRRPLNKAAANTQRHSPSHSASAKPAASSQSQSGVASKVKSFFTKLFLKS
jgi:ATP-dependent RNA helicase RhlE